MNGVSLDTLLQVALGSGALVALFLLAGVLAQAVKLSFYGVPLSTLNLRSSAESLQSALAILLYLLLLPFLLLLVCAQQRVKPLLGVLAFFVAAAMILHISSPSLTDGSPFRRIFRQCIFRKWHAALMWQFDIAILAAQILLLVQILTGAYALRLLTDTHALVDPRSSWASALACSSWASALGLVAAAFMATIVFLSLIFLEACVDMLRRPKVVVALGSGVKVEGYMLASDEHFVYITGFPIDPKPQCVAIPKGSIQSIVSTPYNPSSLRTPRFLRSLVLYLRSYGCLSLRSFPYLRRLVRCFRLKLKRP